MFLNNKRRFLSSTAIALVLTAMSHSSKAATVLVDGTTYGPTDDLTGFTVNSEGTKNVTFTAAANEFFNIGAHINNQAGAASSVTNSRDNSTLNIAITNGGGALGTSGVIFEDDILGELGRENLATNLKVHDTNVTFRGNIADSLTEISAVTSNLASTSNLNFEIANDENLYIDATINKQLDNGDTLNMKVVNTSGNAENNIYFTGNIGGANDAENSEFVSNLTIGDSGGAKTNNVDFSGSNLFTNGINIGVSGRSAKQTHNINFENTQVRGAVSGLAADDIIISQGSGVTTSFIGSVSNIDNMIVGADSTMAFRGDVSDSSITLGSQGATVEFEGENVNADISISENVVGFIEIGAFGENMVNFTGSITAQDGSDTEIKVTSNSKIGGLEGGGNITLANGNDSLESVFGYNVFSSAIDFGAGNDTFTISDDSASLNGSMTNLENISISEQYGSATLFVYQGGSYSGNVTGIGDNATLSIGAYSSNDGYAISDETAATYNSQGTVKNVALIVNGAATFNTNGHEFGSGAESSLRSLDLYDNAIFNIQDNVTVEDMNVEDNIPGGRTSMYGDSTIRIGAGAKLTTGDFYSDSSSSSILIFDVASPTEAGFLEITEENIDLTYLNVQANVTGENSLFSDGNQIKVAQGVGALVGTNGEEGQVSTGITENSARFSINMMDGSKLASPASASDLYLVFSQDATIEEIAVSGNNKNVGSIFDNISNTSNPELSQIIDKINAASESELQSVLESTTPDVGGGVAVGSQNFVNNTLDITNQQIDIAMNSHSGVAAGDRNKGVRMWGQYFFEDATQGKRKGVAGFNSTTNGAALGVDSTELLENSVVGLGVSFGNTKVDSKNASRAENRIDSYQITGYGSYSLPANYFIKAMAAYALNEVKSTRHNVGTLGLNARGEYSANIYTFRADAGKDFHHNSMRFTPSFMTHYSRYDAQNYSETGAGGANLNVNSKALEIFEVGTNLELGWDFKLSNEKRFSPEIRAGYRYDLVGDRFRANSSFAGGSTSFDTLGASPARGALTFGGGLIFQTGDSWDLSLNYEYEKRQNFHSNSGFARAAYHF